MGTGVIGLRLLGALFLIWIVTCVEGAKVSVDWRCSHHIGTDKSFDRKKWITMHESFTDKDLNLKDWLGLVEDQNAYLGREVTRGPLTVVGTPSEKEMERLGRQSKRKDLRSVGTRLYASSNFVVTDRVKNLNLRASPEEFANHAVRYFKYFFDEQIPLPRYYEVLNEAFSSLARHRRGADSSTWGKVIAFHEACARRLQQVFGSKIQVGGYATGWPSHETSDFWLWNARMKRFIDDTGNHIDFISQHLYDAAKESGRHEHLTGGKNEAILDIVEQYTMLKWNRVIPHVISEYGHSSQRWQVPIYGKSGRLRFKRSAPPSPSRDWAILSSVTGMLMGFMDRPDRIRVAIPFMNGFAGWNRRRSKHPFPWSMYRLTKQGLRPTKLTLFYTIMKRVCGDRVMARSNSPNVLSHAFVDGKKGFLLIKNLERRRILVNIENVAVPGKVARAVRKTLYLEPGEDPQAQKQLIERSGSPKLVEERQESLSRPFLMEPEAFTVLEVVFESDAVARRELHTKTYYATSYLKEIRRSSTEEFVFTDIDVPDRGYATLRLSVSRDADKSFRPSVLRVNGEDVRKAVPYRMAGSFDRVHDDVYWTLLKVPIDVKLLRTRNRVEVRFDDSGGFVSSITLQVDKRLRARVLPPAANPKPGNLVRNGDFEMGLESWRASGNAKVSPWDSFSFGASGRVQGGHIEKTIRVQPNSNYVLSARMKSLNGVGSMEVLGLPGRSLEKVDTMQRHWTLERVPIRTGPRDASLKIKFSAQAQNRILFVDEVYLRNTRTANNLEFDAVPEIIPRSGAFITKLQYRSTGSNALRCQLQAMGGSRLPRSINVTRRTETGQNEIYMRVDIGGRPLPGASQFRLICALISTKSSVARDSVVRVVRTY